MVDLVYMFENVEPPDDGGSGGCHRRILWVYLFLAEQSSHNGGLYFLRQKRVHLAA